MYTLCDDVAHREGMFMSPTTYRSLIKPHHARVPAAARELGMMSAIHCGGTGRLSSKTSST
jgi:hypothetical protein